MNPKQWMPVFVCAALIGGPVAPLLAQQPSMETEIEGITEYTLENGLQLLLFPDDSKPVVTVNMTVLVGSRHEGYGETGMAHLLEHMLFKGTPTHKDIPKLLKDRGMINMNGTTWVDRTNYFETLPAGDDNLEFAIRMEADRLVNSLIDANDLASEMTVVRNEFEMGENSPNSILRQRMLAAAYEWHNYGKTTIGNRSDIERVPVTNLRKFYERFYQPDNVMLVIAGQFDQEKALGWVQEYFGSIAAPKTARDNTWTEEPAQDGERSVVLRRVGEVPLAGVVYHVPSASHPEYAAIQVLGNILGQEPAGRLYKDLVVPGTFATISAGGMATHDPGTLLALGQVGEDVDVRQAADLLVESMENLGDFSAEEVNRSVQELLKGREDLLANSRRLAVELSEWRAYGDWRLFFLHRDRLEKVTAADVTAAAKKYLRRDNRTTGIFVPTEEVQRVAIPNAPAVDTMVADYKGRAKIKAGEAFEPTPDNIEQRTIRGQLASGIRYAMLPRKTRGENVLLTLTLHFGDEKSLAGQTTACAMLGTMMRRGTSEMSYQELEDFLDENRITLNVSSGAGSINASVRTRREFLARAIDVLGQVLRNPVMPDDEFEIARKEMLTSLKRGMAEPQMLAFNRMMRTLAPYPEDNVRYVPTIEENIARFEALELDSIKALHRDFVSAQHGELSIVGDFDPEEVRPQLETIFADWTSGQSFERITQVGHPEVPGQRIIIETPDKANAIYVAGLTEKIRDDDPDYEAMMMANYILGSGGLSSRLADRVRKKEGLSYAVGSQFNADDQDERGMFMMFAISAPENSDQVVSTIQEEVQRMLDSGVTGEELDAAKSSYLESRQGRRADDRQLASTLKNQLQVDRTMEFEKRREDRYRALTKEQVDKAMRRIVDPRRLTIITAGDFAKVRDEAEQPADQADPASDASDGRR